MILRISGFELSADINRDGMCFKPVHNVLNLRGESTRRRLVIFLG